MFPKNEEYYFVGIAIIPKKGMVIWREKIGCKEEEVPDRRVSAPCMEGKISGVTHKGRRWMIPANAKRPEQAVYVYIFLGSVQ